MHRTQPSHPASLSSLRRAFADRIHMFNAAPGSVPFLERVNNSFLNLRRRSCAPPPRPTDCLQAKCQTRLVSTSLALPASARANSNNLLSLDDLASAFDADVDPEQIVTLEAVSACARQRRLPGSHLCMELRVHARSMNTAAPSMRRSLGVASIAERLARGGLRLHLLPRRPPRLRRRFLTRQQPRPSACAACNVCDVRSARRCGRAQDRPARRGHVRGLSAVLLMLIGRIIAGIASGATTVVTPIYLGELALAPARRLRRHVPARVRVRSAVGAGDGLPSILGTDGLWPVYILGGVGLPTLLQLLMQHRLLESPQWLVSRSATTGRTPSWCCAAARRRMDDSARCATP